MTSATTLFSFVGDIGAKYFKILKESLRNESFVYLAPNIFKILRVTFSISVSGISINIRAAPPAKLRMVVCGCDVKIARRIRSKPFTPPTTSVAKNPMPFAISATNSLCCSLSSAPLRMTLPSASTTSSDSFSISLASFFRTPFFN